MNTAAEKAIQPRSVGLLSLPTELIYIIFHYCLLEKGDTRGPFDDDDYHFYTMRASGYIKRPPTAPLHLMLICRSLRNIGERLLFEDIRCLDVNSFWDYMSVIQKNPGNASVARSLRVESRRRSEFFLPTPRLLPLCVNLRSILLEGISVRNILESLPRRPGLFPHLETCDLVCWKSVGGLDGDRPGVTLPIDLLLPIVHCPSLTWLNLTGIRLVSADGTGLNPSAGLTSSPSRERCARRGKRLKPLVFLIMTNSSSEKEAAEALLAVRSVHLLDVKDVPDGNDSYLDYGLRDPIPFLPPFAPSLCELVFSSHGEISALRDFQCLDYVRVGAAWLQLEINWRIFPLPRSLEHLNLFLDAGDWEKTVTLLYELFEEKQSSVPNLRCIEVTFLSLTLGIPLKKYSYQRQPLPLSDPRATWPDQIMVRDSALHIVLQEAASRFGIALTFVIEEIGYWRM